MAKQDREPGLPTEAQLAYAKGLGLEVPADADSADVSAMLSAHLDGDAPASERARWVAEHFDVRYSRYIGEEALYGLLFHTLAEPGREADLVSWYALAVYRDITGRDEHDPAVDEVAVELVSDASVVGSIRRCRPLDLRRFGTWTDDEGFQREGGSRRTNAYKAVSAALRDRLGLEAKKEPGATATTTASTGGRGGGCLSAIVVAAAVFTLVVLLL